MSRYHLAQLNIAMLRDRWSRPAWPTSSPTWSASMPGRGLAGLSLALADEAGDATAIRPFGAAVLVNLSLWRDVQSLSDYVYKSAHSEMLKRRRGGSTRPSRRTWCCGGCRPTIALAWKRQPSVWRTCASMVPAPMPSLSPGFLRRRMRFSPG